MATIIKQRELVKTTGYTRDFDYADDPGAGFSFECDEYGKPKLGNSAARGNFNLCITGVVRGERVIDRGVTRHDDQYMSPAILKCDCGREVVLAGFTNTCECGADYNSSGQRLAPREQWGEETGESPSDILRIP